MSTPNQPWSAGPPPWVPPSGQQSWGAPAQPGWGPSAPAGRSPVLPVLGIAVALVALVASLLPYYRVEVTDRNTLEYTGWQQRFSGPELGGDAVFLAHGVALVLACAVLVAGAVVLLAARTRPLGAALLATGAGMVAGYCAFVLADLVNTAAQGSSRASVGAGGWLQVLAGAASVVVLVLALRTVAAAGRR